MNCYGELVRYVQIILALLCYIKIQPNRLLLVKGH